MCVRSRACVCRRYSAAFSRLNRQYESSIDMGPSSFALSACCAGPIELLLLLLLVLLDVCADSPPPRRMCWCRCCCVCCVCVTLALALVMLAMVLVLSRSSIVIIDDVFAVVPPRPDARLRANIGVVEPEPMCVCWVPGLLCVRANVEVVTPSSSFTKSSS
jgi:hypothetical protein